MLAGNQGYLDKLQVDQVKLFEREVLYPFFDSKHGEILHEIKPSVSCPTNCGHE